MAHSTPTLSDYFHVNRRYSRSINLERDADYPEVVSGYVFTERSTDALKRILTALVEDHTPSAWTLSGVYGTGKSAFAHFLAALCAPSDSLVHQQAMAIVGDTFGPRSWEYTTLRQYIPASGLFRALVTAQREPLRQTLIRALYQGAIATWPTGRPSKLVRTLQTWAQAKGDDPTVSNTQILSMLQEVAIAARTDVVVIIDELGKVLEFAAQTQGAEDLYLLQQIAELAQQPDGRIHLLSVLHQSFADYSHRLAATERLEWAKIQGRFEDISFNDSPAQMTRLVGQAIQPVPHHPYTAWIAQHIPDWTTTLQGLVPGLDTPTQDVSILVSTLPLHPLTAIVLPMLCARYAQSDRSLFTFLTSAEPYALQPFLEHTSANSKTLTTLKLHHLYDYFVEAVGTSLGSRPNLQRWIEIQTLITDARRLEPETLALLKTIGILNLVTSTGELRATRSLVALAMVETPRQVSQQKAWQQRIQQLLQQGLITHLKTLDELRLWEGSDFDVEAAIATYRDQERSPLADLLTTAAPLSPLIAQRHSYRTGTLRYFERQYLDRSDRLEHLTCSRTDYDGLIVYWVGEESLQRVPQELQDGRPLIILEANALPTLRDRVLEYAALQYIQTRATPLQSDGVARRDVGRRLIHARRLLDEVLSRAFAHHHGSHPCWVQGEPEPIPDTSYFNTMLSTVCDRIYPKSPILWNELINRRSLTSQGAKARRELIEAMLTQANQPRLGLQGYGPEVSMYYSVLAESGIHRCQDHQWGFYPPNPTQDSTESYLMPIWQAVDDVCHGASPQPVTIADLYQHLAAPPYGMKLGAIPILLAAFLLYNVDTISVYKDGTFIPVLGAEHFELLVKAPERFALKYIDIVGVRSQVFKALEDILVHQGATARPHVRNATLLSVMTPLFQFVRKLPPYTLKTAQISLEARRVIQTLLAAQEPDHLLFITLPQACGLEPILANQADEGAIAHQFQQRLTQILKEIQAAYDHLLNHCHQLLQAAFGLDDQADMLRNTLQMRASALSGQIVERMLNQFLLAVCDQKKDDRAWLESLVMIIADKPAESWSDGDRDRFELTLKDLSKRFQRLEVLHQDLHQMPSLGIDARRITISNPDGHEVQCMAWFTADKLNVVDPWIEDILDHLNDPQLRDAFYARLTERLYEQHPPVVPEEKPTKSRRKPKKETP